MGWLGKLILGVISDMAAPLVNAIVGFLTFVVLFILSLFEYAIKDVFSCNLDTFNNTFPAIKTTEVVIVSMATALCTLICLWQVFKSMWGNIVDETEEVWKVFIRTAVCMFLIFNSHSLCNMFLNVGQTFYVRMSSSYTSQGWMALITNAGSFATNTANDYTEQFHSAVDGDWSFLIDNLVTLVTDLCGVCLLIPVGYNYVKLICEAVERYIVLAFLTYTAPLAFAMGTSRSTSNIVKNWGRMYGAAILMVIFNVWTLTLFRSSVENFGKIMGDNKYMATMLLYLAFLKAAQRLDSYMSSMGISVAQTGGSMLDDFMGSVSTLNSMGSTVKGVGNLAAAAVGAAPKAAGFIKGAFLGGGKNKKLNANDGATNAVGSVGALGMSKVSGEAKASGVLSTAAQKAKNIKPIEDHMVNGHSKAASFGQNGKFNTFQSKAGVGMINGQGQYQKSVSATNQQLASSIQREHSNFSSSNGIGWRDNKGNSGTVDSFAPKGAFATDEGGRVISTDGGIAFGKNGEILDRDVDLFDNETGEPLGTVSSFAKEHSNALSSESTPTDFNGEYDVRVSPEDGVFDITNGETNGFDGNNDFEIADTDGFGDNPFNIDTPSVEDGFEAEDSEEFVPEEQAEDQDQEDIFGDEDDPFDPADDLSKQDTDELP